MAVTIYGPDGKPASLRSLTSEQAHGHVGHVRQPFDPEVTMGLTPQRLQQILLQARQGDHEDYLSMAHEMEHRDSHYYSCLQTRKLAVFALPFNIEAADESDEEEALAEELRELVNGFRFRLAVLDILDGLGKGFSVVEVVWDTSENQWWPDEFKWRNQRWFRFDDYATAERLLLQDGSAEGEELLPFKFICHKPKIVSGLSLAGGLARTIAALHLFKGYAMKDWMAFAEVFGMPIRIGTYDEGATDKQKAELRRAVRDIGSDAAAIIPHTMSIIFERAAMSGNAGSDEFFMTLANWLNKEESKAVLGQTMTSEDGSSLAQAQVHNEVRIDIRNADAWQLTNTVNRDLIRPYVDINRGPRERNRYPRFVIDTREPEDLVALAKALIPFINVGLPVEKKTVLDKFNLPEPEEGADLLQVIQATDENGAPTEKKNPQQDNQVQALITWMNDEMSRNTNMRTFKRRWAEKVESLCA